MAMKLSRQKLSRLYEADETGWLEEMARLIGERQYDQLDYKHLREYLQDMAARDRREVFHRLVTLLVHVLKWQYQPLMRSRSWELTIRNQREDLREEFKSKTLKNHAVEVLSKAYDRAVRQAAAETGLAERTFPPECPYTLDDVLAEGHLPGSANEDE
jgi:hypothetical protein